MAIRQEALFLYLNTANVGPNVAALRISLHYRIVFSSAPEAPYCGCARSSPLLAGFSFLIFFILDRHSVDIFRLYIGDLR
jgi:hypothetical protein